MIERIPVRGKDLAAAVRRLEGEGKRVVALERGSGNADWMLRIRTVDLALWAPGPAEDSTKAARKG